MTTDTYWHTDARDFVIGQRVEFHPAMDAWMAGDRFGVVVKNPPSAGSMVWVRTDRSGRTHPSPGETRRAGR